MQRAWLELFTPPVLLLVGVLFSIVLVAEVGKSNFFSDARGYCAFFILLALSKTISD